MLIESEISHKTKKEKSHTNTIQLHLRTDTATSHFTTGIITIHRFPSRSQPKEKAEAEKMFNKT